MAVWAINAFFGKFRFGFSRSNLPHTLGCRVVSNAEAPSKSRYNPFMKFALSAKNCLIFVQSATLCVLCQLPCPQRTIYGKKGDRTFYGKQKQRGSIQGNQIRVGLSLNTSAAVTVSMPKSGTERGCCAACEKLKALSTPFLPPFLTGGCSKHRSRSLWYTLRRRSGAKKRLLQ